MLVHMMREAEQQVEEIGYDISRLAYSHADAVVKGNRSAVARLSDVVATDASLSNVLSRTEFSALSLVLVFSEDRTFKSVSRVAGARRIRNARHVGEQDARDDNEEDRQGRAGRGAP